ncbi:MAG TPA: lipoyl(octanoyl) transferase LipB [Acidiferrobacteraceae bacterium]|nr:lipoyl(octanoyl) transferase LipB [Acidiferrobacteraceae bacterium]
MSPVKVRPLKRQVYADSLAAMQQFVDHRTPSTGDEIWLLEHEPVFTLGRRLSSKPFPQLGDIPVAASDRGGDITYHGPGQLVVYLLLDLRRRGWGARQLVTALEQSVIDLLAVESILGQRRLGAPGVYVAGRKIAALGLRVRGGYTYHGLSLNVNMDLGPFKRIDPCGYPGLEVTQCADLGIGDSVAAIADRLLTPLCRHLTYTVSSKF